MNDFIFKKAFYFSLHKKIKWTYKSLTHIITIKNHFLNYKTEFSFIINNKKSNISLIKNGLSKTFFNGHIGSNKIIIEQYPMELSIGYCKKKYVFIFQKGLITGVFIKNKNVGIIKQKANVNFGLDQFYGFSDINIPEEILFIFLVLFQKTYAKEGYLFYKHKGFTSIEPRMLCDTY